MLIRKNYYDYKRKQISSQVLEVLDHLNGMIEQSDEFLLQPTKDNEDTILQTENYIDRQEEDVEKYILEIISLEQLDTSEIKWLFSMNRIIRELERVGDQLTNILTISDVVDTSEIQPKVRHFFNYEQTMMEWLSVGIEEDNIEKLDAVIDYDAYVDQLNKETFQDMVDIIHKKDSLTESKLKMVVISRFLERIGDHLVNAAKVYKRYINIANKVTDEQNK